MPSFYAKNITKTYQVGDVQVNALRGVDFELKSREFLVIVGPSGGGKSTLLNILGGLDVPSSGKVFFDDHDLSQATEKQLTIFRREHVGYVFQSYNLIPTLTALENVQLVAEISDNPMNPQEALELVGMSHRLDHFPSQLSGGEQQRIAIARAITKQPDILLCDEPTGALDCETGRVVLSAIEKINQNLGTMIALITHNMVIAQMADRALHLADGRIASVDINPSRKPASSLQW